MKHAALRQGRLHCDFAQHRTASRNARSMSAAPSRPRRSLRGREVDRHVADAQACRGATQSFKRTKAVDLPAFLKVSTLAANSSNNTLFADDKGNIALLLPQFVPKRNDRLDYPDQSTGPIRQRTGTARPQPMRSPQLSIRQMAGPTTAMTDRGGRQVRTVPPGPPSRATWTPRFKPPNASCSAGSGWACRLHAAGSD